MNPTALTPPDDSPEARERALEAVRELLRWIGEDPEREGLSGTPRRVVDAYLEYFRGYGEDPRTHLAHTFEEVGGYDEIILLRDVPFHSHCEHHMAPIQGKVHVAYLPNKRVVGISKLVRVVPSHGCMTCRGVETPNVTMTTSCMLGAFREDEKSRSELMRLIGY